MFELMETASGKLIIQVFGLGKKGQELCNYIKNEGIIGVEYIVENEDKYTNPITISTSSNLALAIGVDQECSNQPIEASDLNFYLVDESDLPDQMDEIQRYVDQTCLNCLVIINHNSIMETGSEKVKNWIKQMDSFLPLPLSPYHDNEVLFLIDQNEMAYRFVQGISEIITRPGLICTDFADVRTILFKMGRVVMGTFSATGKDRSIRAVEHIYSSPPFSYFSLSRAKGILVNMSAGLDMSIVEFDEVVDSIRALAADNATIIFAAPLAPELNGEMRVTAFATGLTEPSV